MFGFVSKLRTEVTNALTTIHERIVNLEVKVEALFKSKEADVAAKVDAAPKEVVNAVATEVVDATQEGK